jgi:hypothetical protein
MLNKDEFYNRLTEKRGDSAELKSCIEETVQKLLDNETNIDKPGMLLGKIQSGKTRAFIGAIALAFENGYDITVVLTKGTKALAQQTYERLKRDFKEFVDDDKVQICDIMHLPKNFPQYVLKQKLIIVVKKETNNMKRIIEALINTYPDLSQKKLLIIDDEADYASVGFRFNKNEGILQINKIARQINELREKVASYDFLQVTATPYSLYLQPEEFEIEEIVFFKPIRPAFSVLLQKYEGYIGGDYYFAEDQEQNTISSYIYEEVSQDELDTLKKEDRRSFKLEESLISTRIRKLRQAMINFIVGACIRRIQQEKSGKNQNKYSFIIHTEQHKKCHTWQETIVKKVKELLIESFQQKQELLHKLIRDSYDNLSHSIGVMKLNLPDFEEVFEKVCQSLSEDYLMITKVNSEKDAEELLDDNGQLKLLTPLNIFIGGQILDRGLTIENLIGFYYGRQPNKFQQDTVLQHSRMYGNRDKEDLVVTRFYTARVIYDAMKRIHEFDTALREAFEKGAQDAGVVFVHQDPSNRIIPCSPNKILLSTTTTLRPYKRMLPIGFQTGYKTNIKGIIELIDRKLSDLQIKDKPESPFLIDLSTAQEIINEISKTLEFEPGFEWDIKAFKASMEYLSKNTSNQDQKEKIWCLVRTDRNLSRKKEDESFSDAPDTPKTEGAIAKETALDVPMLMLFKQNGKEELGWRGSSFWWPVLVAPNNTPIVIFASDIVDVTST